MVLAIGLCWFGMTTLGLIMGAMDYIREYVEQTEKRVPIFTDDIYKYVSVRVPSIKRNVLNEYIIRYGKKNPNFVRYKKGVYYTTEDTPFGKAEMMYFELIKRIYLQDGDRIIGYETGPSYINKIGLTTQISRCTYLVTQKAKRTITNQENGICLLKPIINITNKNYRYLQFLDILDNRMNVQIEAKNYCEILRGYIKKFHLNYEQLVGYARFYNNQSVFMKLAELATGIEI